MSSLEQTAAVLYGEQKYPQALDIYLSLYRKNPKTEKYSIYCGSCLDALGKPAQAIKFYQKASKLNPASVSTLLALSYLYYQKADYANAVKFCERVLKLEPHNTSAWLNLGNIAYCQGAFEKALSYYEKVYLEDDKNYLALINMANTCFDLKYFASAIEYAHKTLKIYPSSFDAYLIRGNSYLELGKYAKAEEELLLARELNVKNPWVYNAFSRLYQKLERWDEALSAGWKAILCEPDAQDEQHINFGYLLYEYMAEKEGTLAATYAHKWLEKFIGTKLVLYMANAILNNQQIECAEPRYVGKMFDVFAPDFDTTLAGLEYKAPQFLAEAAQKVCAKPFWRPLNVLDLGCGTGLCAEKLKKTLGWCLIDGVDLSAKMLEQAADKKLYHHLKQADITTYLSNCANAYPLVTACDVLTYFGNLKTIFDLVARVLKPQGAFIFTVSENRIDDADYHLMPSGRFVHNISYVKKLLKYCGLSLISCDRKALRTEGDKIVYGYVVAVRKQFTIAK